MGLRAIPERSNCLQKCYWPCSYRISTKQLELTL